MMRTRLAVIVSLVAALTIVPATGSRADGSFVFYGSGFGHGIGMSQWGAYGLALKGWTHQQILTHYYTGTTVAQAKSEPAKIRVGLVDGTQSVHLTAKVGPVTLRVGSPAKTATVA